MDSWALQAVEEAAMRRAVDQILRGQKEFRVCGLTMRQIVALKRFYEEQTGKMADEIEV